MRVILLRTQILGSLLVFLVVQVWQSKSNAADTTGTKLLCDCSLNDVRSNQLVVACSKTKDEDAGVSCRKELVSKISRGYRYVPGHGLFKHFNTVRTWAKAKKTCELDGGHLFIPSDSQLTAILVNIYGQQQMFAGLSDTASEGIYLGVDNKVYFDLKWSQGEPNGGRKENCVTIVWADALNDNDCGGIFPFICQRHLNGVPPEGYVYSDGFGFYKVYGDKKSYPEAQKVCEADGGQLAVPETQDEAEALVSVIRSDPQRLEYVWIGLNDTKEEGRFVTVSGTPLSSLEYVNWRTGEPNDQHPGEDCALIFNDGTMNDNECDAKRSFVCELSIPAR